MRESSVAIRTLRHAGPSIPREATQESLDTSLRRQSADDLVEILLELAEHQEPVRERLARLQLAAQPEKLATAFRRSRQAYATIVVKQDFKGD